VLVVPQKEGPFDDLKVFQIETACQVCKQHVRDLGQLVGTKQFQDFFEFVEKHDLFPKEDQGQHLKNLLRMGVAVSASFSTYWMMQ